MTHSGTGVCIAAVQDYCVIIYSIVSSARASTDGGMARPAISGRSAINDEMAQFDFCGAPFGVQ
jgi:hypothetical protein